MWMFRGWRTADAIVLSRSVFGVSKEGALCFDEELIEHLQLLLATPQNLLKCASMTSSLSKN